MNVAAIAGIVLAAQVTVVSKNFDESRLLAEMFARVIEEHTDLSVERRFNLAGTDLCHAALVSGSADLYPEYTGTGLLSILKGAPDTDPARVLGKVRREFLARWDLVWLDPLGFENSYEIAVRRELAEKHGIRTISDLVPHASEMHAGFGYEFSKRPDGLPGLAELYGLRFGEVSQVQQTLKWKSAADGQIDVLDVYTTDGKIDAIGVVVLQDDKRFFPPYAAAPLVRGETLKKHPEIRFALSMLAGALDEERMRALNRRLQEGGDPVELVAQDALLELGLIASARDIDVVRSKGVSLPVYMWGSRATILSQTGWHLVMVGWSLLLACATAIPLGVLLERWRGAAEPAIRAVGLIQTVPSIALLAFMIPVLGIGVPAAVAALFLYSLFPIVRNTFTGVRDADPAAVAAATALGMRPGQVLVKVRLPLAAPVIMAGVRTAAVINVGTTTLAAFIGAGGLGEPIVAGLQMLDDNIILSGAIPAAVLAVVVDLALAGMERVVRPRGVS